MHRYREFGLTSEQDEALRRAFRDGFKRAGLAFPQFMEALAWYRDHARPGLDEAQLVEAFSAFAADRGWSADHRDGALGIYRTIREQGPASVADAAPDAEVDRARLARGEDLLRRDPAAYWRDAELQDALFEARERLGGATSAEAEPTAGGAERDRQRVHEIEGLLRDPSGDGQRRYWNDAALRHEYAQALGRLHGDISSRDSINAEAAAPSVRLPAVSVESGTVQESA